MKKALLCVSFGTSVPQARRSIEAVEAALGRTAPEWRLARAFTSTIIRKILARRDEEIPGVVQALEQLHREGVTDVVVQPTHILPGIEYDKIRREIEPWRDEFSTLAMGQPLLRSMDDLRELAGTLAEAYPPRDGEALVLFGHGTDHPAGAMYPALQTVFHLMGRKDVLVGTVEGWPGYEEVAAQVSGRGWRQVRLVPLMLVAGDHAINDMAGPSDSWKTRLKAEGCQVCWESRGLGELAGVQELYCHHLRRTLEEAGYGL